MGKSSQLRLSDVREVFRVLGDVRDLRHDRAAAQERMVLGMCRLVGARQGASLHWRGFSPKGKLHLLDFVTGGWETPEGARAARAWEELMQQPDWRGDPILDGATRVRGTVVACHRRELVDDPAWYRSEVANVVARTAGIDAHLVSWFRRDGADEQISGIALHRAWGDRDFTERDKQTLLLFTSELYRLYKTGDLDVTRHLSSGGDAGLPALSPRQREVLTRLLAGDSLKQVAQRLGVTRHTIDEHVGIIYRKFGVNSRAELLARFVSGGRTGRASDA